MSRTRFRLLLIVALLLLVGGVACNKPQQEKKVLIGPGLQPARPGDFPPRTTRDLEQDEAAGGHTLERHVDKSVAELRARLAHEHVAAASTYMNRQTAERAVTAAIAANQQRIQSWLNRSGGHPNLVLDYDSPTPIGRTLRRGESSPSPCSHALVILRWKPPSSYYVLTSYPECR